MLLFFMPQYFSLFCHTWRRKNKKRKAKKMGFFFFEKKNIAKKGMQNEKKVNGKWVLRKRESYSIYSCERWSFHDCNITLTIFSFFSQTVWSVPLFTFSSSVLSLLRLAVSYFEFLKKKTTLILPKVSLWNIFWNMVLNIQRWCYLYVCMYIFVQRQREREKES